MQNISILSSVALVPKGRLWVTSQRSLLTDLGRPRRNGKSPGRKTVRWETVAWENACLGNYSLENCLSTLPRRNRCPVKIGVWGRPTQHNRMWLYLEPDKMYQEQWSAEIAPSSQL